MLNFVDFSHFQHDINLILPDVSIFLKTPGKPKVFHEVKNGSNSQKLVNLVNIYLLKVNNRHTRAKLETCSKLTIKTRKRRHWCC